MFGVSGSDRSATSDESFGGRAKFKLPKAFYTIISEASGYFGDTF
jgi:hypothetical protein